LGCQEIKADSRSTTFDELERVDREKNLRQGSDRRQKPEDEREAKRRGKPDDGNIGEDDGSQQSHTGQRCVGDNLASGCKFAHGSSRTGTGTESRHCMTSSSGLLPRSQRSGWSVSR